MKSAGWILSAALSAYACSLAAHHPTPVDHALPLMAVLVTVVAWATYPAVMVAVPLLIAAEIAVPDEGMRLLAFGLICSAAVALPLVRQAELSPLAKTVIAVACVILLRWIPYQNVLLVRELFIVAVAAAIVIVLGSTPFAMAVGVVTALITPAVPLRTLALPLLVLFVAIAARLIGMPELKLTLPSALVLSFAMLFFAWSGIVARAFPYFLKQAGAGAPRQWIGEALPANATLLLEVPHGAASLIVSGANVPRLRRGAMLGTVNGAPVRVGDAADWGYMRREHYFGSRNPLPRDPAGKIRDYGYSAWVDGAGRIPLPRGVRTIRVTADAGLPADAALQVEAFELQP